MVKGAAVKEVYAAGYDDFWDVLRHHAKEDKYGKISRYVLRHHAKEDRYSKISRYVLRHHAKEDRYSKISSMYSDIMINKVYTQTL